MGTRSIIVVTGAGRHGGNQTVRLYKHWDGYPTGNLPILVEATALAQRMVDNLPDYITSEKGEGVRPGLDEMPAGTFAAFVSAASIYWADGAGAKIDREDGDPADYSEPLAPKHFGNQGDLEWVYVVDMRARTIAVYSGGYETAAETVARGPVDPRTYADQLMDEYKGDEFMRINCYMDQLMEAGWELAVAGSANPPTSGKKTRKRKAGV